MKLSISRKNATIILMLGFSIFYLYFWRWLRVAYGQAYILVYAIFAYFLVKSSKSTRYERAFFSLSLCFLLYMLLNSKGDRETAIYNIVQQIVPSFISLYFFVHIVSDNSRRKYVENLLYDKLYSFLTVYFVINSLVILIQSFGNGFLMTVIEGGNVDYADNTTGFIGPSGTHVLTFTYILLLLLGWNKILRSRGKMKTRYIRIVIVEILVMVIESLFNDNNMFYILLICYIALLISMRNLSSINLIQKVLFTIVGIIFVVVLAYFVSPRFRSVLDDRVFYQLRLYSQFSTTNNQSAERFSLVQYAWRNIDNKLLGNGFAAVKMHYPEDFIRHFGMNDISSFLYLGGLIFTITMPIFYFMTIIKSLRLSKGLPKFVFFVIMLLLFVYTQPMSELGITLSFLMSLLPLVSIIDSAEVRLWN